MKIYVIGSSKNNFLPLDDIREKFIIDEQHDEDNIDDLNPWYCELTGLYYLWKHVDDEIVGLEHYRRYFCNKNNKLISESEINQILVNNDIIAPYQYNRFHEWYCNPKLMLFSKLSPCGQLSDETKHFLFCLRYNDEEFWKFIDKIWLNKKYILSNNMFIGKKNIIDEYCNLIFTTLDFCHKTFPNDYNNHTKRLYGYITECIFGAWLEYKNYKIFSGNKQVVE